MSFLQNLHDGLRFLALPQFALTEGAILVFVIARVVYVIGKKITDKKQKLYWKGIAFVADILSIVGLIGLSATAGHLLLDQDVRAARDAESRTGMALQREQTAVLGQLCNPMSGDKRPTNANIEAMNLCAAVHDLGGFYKPDTNWDQKRLAFFSLTVGKPSSDGFASEAGRFVELVDTYREAKDKIPEAEWNVSSMQLLISPTLVVVCLALAVLGLALKVAKSAWEFKEQLGL